MTFSFEYRLSDSPFVEAIWRTESHYGGSFNSLAASQWEMVITKYQGKTSFTVRGPETKASNADFPSDAEFFGIIFKLGTFMPHLPLKERLNRKDITLPEATNQSFWLLGSAWQIPTFDNADTFLARLTRDGLLAHDQVVNVVLQGQSPNLSPRAVQYRFLHATGLTYNTIQQINRAQQAMSLLQQGRSILDVVYETGYFDQPHLTRSLKRFAGQTPSEIALLNPLTQIFVASS